MRAKCIKNVGRSVRKGETYELSELRNVYAIYDKNRSGDMINAIRKKDLNVYFDIANETTPHTRRTRLQG